MCLRGKFFSTEWLLNITLVCFNNPSCLYLGVPILNHVKQALRTSFITLLLVTITFAGIAQLRPVYIFQQDDSLVKKSYYLQAFQNNNRLLSSLDKQYKDDYKEIYEARFSEVAKLLQSTRTVTAPEANNYLQAVLKKIIDANSELKGLGIRLIFSRDRWPNAFSMGEGTLTVNAGLMIFLDNEAELVFVICHELAHYYLDHSNKTIKKNIETINSEEFKKEIQRLSKEEFRVGEQLEILVKKFAFGSHRHIRENEAEADRQAFMFMKNTGYDCGAIKTCLQLLDKVDESILQKPLNLEQVFNFNEYSFKKKWIQKESVIFGQMTDDDSPLTRKEKDSLKTHPDCQLRILMLEDSIQKVNSGEKFIVNENLFRKLKKDFFVEMTEQEFRNNNLSRNLYYSLMMLQEGEHIPYAVYSIARCMNLVYKNQKNHTLRNTIEREGRGYPADYNLLLRMFDRLRLEEIASLNYFFCMQYREQMSGYSGFWEVMNEAKKNKNDF